MAVQRNRLLPWLAIAVTILATAACNGANPFSASTTPTTGTTGTTGTTTPTPVTFAVTAAVLTVDNPSVNVTCPATVNFTANVTSNKDGVIVYNWERSDGSATPTQTLTFPAATSLNVSGTWQITSTYSGWQRLHVLSPTDLASNSGTFTVTCK